MSKFELIGVGSNAKTIKGDGSEYLTGILYMQPYKIDVDGKTFNSCAMAELAQCHKPCLHTAGRAGIIRKGETTNSILSARQRKAEWFYRDRSAFMLALVRDIAKHARYCAKRDIQAVIRLNGTTDIKWEVIKVERDGDTFANIFEAFPEVQFYDYTKMSNRRVDHIPNYHLTWSYSGASERYRQGLARAVNSGMSVAVVFRKEIPATWQGLQTIDGDADDMRFLDPAQSVVALKAKGKAKRDKSGFVVDV